MSSEPDSNDTIANLSAIPDTSNDLTNLLDVPVCSDLNYDPFKFTENNNYFMCDGIDPDSNMHSNICVNSLYYTESEFNEHFILNLNKRVVLTFLWFISTAEVWPILLIN